MRPLPFRLRAATADDVELTYEITKDAMCDFVEQTWGRWEEGEQRARHWENYTPDTHRLVDVEGAVVGFVAAENLPTHLWLVKLYLHSSVRGKGIGSALLVLVLREADELGKPVRLRVLRVNMRAQALYARYGFNVVERTPERIFMERPVRASGI
jgi:GNAT superfamily N-acetyltransferase